jgi:hypothetical protein
MKYLLLYYLLKPFKKLTEIKYAKVYFKEKFFNIYIYEILGKNEYIITDKKINDFEYIKFAKFTKFKNYYII